VCHDDNRLVAAGTPVVDANTVGDYIAVDPSLWWKGRLSSKRGDAK
jgi:hypothetical protein